MLGWEDIMVGAWGGCFHFFLQSGSADQTFSFLFNFLPFVSLLLRNLGHNVLYLLCIYALITHHIFPYIWNGSVSSILSCSFFMPVYTCFLHVCKYAHVCVCVCVSPRLILGTILDCSFTLFLEIGVLNQTQSSLIWLLLLTSSLWELTYLCWGYSWASMPTLYLSGF